MTDRPTFEEWKRLVAEVDPTLQTSLKEHNFWKELYNQDLSPEVAAPMGVVKAALIRKTLLDSLKNKAHGV